MNYLLNILCIGAMAFVAFPGQSANSPTHVCDGSPVLPLDELPALTRSSADEAPDLVYDPTGEAVPYIQTSFQVVNNEIVPEGGKRVTVNIDKEGGKVWFKNLIGQYSEGWVCGDIQGDKILLKSRQALGYDGSHLLRLGMGTADVDGRPIYADEVYLSYDAETGEISLQPGYYLFALNYGVATNTLRGYAVEHKFRPMPNPVAIPDNAEVKEYLVEGFSVYNQMNVTTRTLQVAHIGSEYYVSGLSVDSAHDFLIGNRMGNEIVLANGQFVYGVEESVLSLSGCQGITLDSSTGIINSTMTDAIRLIIDEEAGTITLPEGFGISETPWGFSTDGAWDVLCDLTMVPKTAKDLPAVPAPPTYVTYLGFGFDSLYIEMDNKDEDGNYINENNLEYEVYINSHTEPYVFRSDSFTCFAEDRSRIPFEFLDFNYFSGFSRYRTIAYTGNVSIAGVRTIYTVDGVENMSRIVWMGESGISSIEEDAEVSHKEYYDTFGRKLEQPSATGIVIEVSTYSDGHRESRKIITGK